MHDVDWLIQTFGPTGAVLALGLMIVRSLAPMVQTYLSAQTDALRRIGDVQERMDTRLTRIEDLLLGRRLSRRLIPEETNDQT